MKRVAVIMAGGSGERFWPLSRKSKPKQLLKLIHPGKTMLGEAIDRISPLIPPEDIYIITGEALLEPIRKAAPSLPPENVIAEPVKRNTAPCLSLASGFLRAKYSGLSTDDLSVAVLTADQLIRPEDAFLGTVDAAMKHSEKHESITTIGILPTRPETGYGYIEINDKEDEYNGVAVHNVKNFKEKPDIETAQEYVKSGKYLWNSGMFFWKLNIFDSEMSAHVPELGNKISEISESYYGKTTSPLKTCNDAIKELFSSFPDISIDFGLMERTKKVSVALAKFDWDDIGAWDSLRRIHETDKEGNVSIGNNIVLATGNSVVFNRNDDTLVAVYGMDNVCVVANGDAFLVLPTSKTQEIKKIVGEIREKKDKYL